MVHAGSGRVGIVGAGAGPARRRWPWRRRLPACGLLAALATVFLFAPARDHFYSHHVHDGHTAKNLTLAQGLTAERGFLFLNMRRRADGGVRYELYNRFPIGAFVLIKLAIAPFDGDFSAQIAAARALMLAFFCAAALLAYLALARVAGSRAVAAGATLLAFSAYHLLHYADAVTNEMSVDLFAVMLVFHGAVLFEAAGGKRRFGQLACKVCGALLLGWHAYGFLAPYLAFGAGQAALGGWPAGAGATVPARLGAAAAGVLRGRHVLLGAVALLFGAGVLGYNIAREHAVFDGERAVSELPSVRSMLRRTGLQATSYSGAEELEWPAFLKRQFHRVGAASLPFALTEGADLDELAWQGSGTPWLVWLGVFATIGCFAGLVRLRCPRAPPAALALAGFGWAFLVPSSTAWSSHQFETMFHIGVPLILFAALFAALLVGARPLSRQQATWSQSVTAIAAAVVFAGSSVAMSWRHLDKEEQVRQRAQMAEFDAISGTIRGRSVWVAAHPEVFDRFVKCGPSVGFFTAGSLVHDAGTLGAANAEAIAALDYLLAFERYDVPALLTPSHRQVFLYEAGTSADSVLAAMRGARRRDVRRLEARPPVARAGQGWNIHMVPGEETARGAGELAYLKVPCARDDVHGQFRLRLAPVDSRLPWGARLGFELREFLFPWAGVVVDGKCLLRVPLPRWPVAGVRTEQIRPGGGAALWQVAFRLDVDRLRAELAAARDQIPAARGAFDVYLRGRAMRYVRAPCVHEDVRGRFFLHVVPTALSALPHARRRAGFDNLDFDFAEHGALLDGVHMAPSACVAALQLPDYDIASVRTGQFDANGVTWRVEFAPREPADP